MYNQRRTWNFRDDETIFDMMRLFQNLNGQFEPIIKEMTENMDFTIATLQWDKEVRRILNEARRPANSYNLLRTIFNVIIAVELQNRKQIIAKPKSGGDNQLAQTLTQVLLHFLTNAGFDYVRTKVFLDSIIARLGVYFVGWSYENNPLGELSLEAVDPREMMYEPNYSDPLWSKSSYIMRKHSLSLEEILNKFSLNDIEMQSAILEEAAIFFEKEPNKRDKWISKRLKALFSAVYETATGYTTSSDNSLFKNYLQWWNPVTGKFDVLELHEKRTERRLMAQNEEGTKLYDITDPYISVIQQNNQTFDGIRFEDKEAIEKVKQDYSIQGEPRVELDNRRFVTAVVPAFNLKVNEQAYPFKSDYYVYIPQYCYDYHADPLKAQSVMDDLKDPQKHFNKAQSLKLELLGRYANKGWIMDENAIEGLEEDWSSERIAPYRRVRAGYINQIKPEEGQTISPDLVRDPLETQSLMKVISNADDEIRGQASDDIKSGKHFIAKEEQQTKSFSYMFSNVNRSSRAVAEMSVNMIQHYVTTQRIFRITEDIDPNINSTDNETQELVVNQSNFGFDPETGRIIEKIKNDLTIGEYDILISDTPYSSNAKEMEYRKLVDLFNAAAQINPKKADALLNIMVEAGSYPNATKILKMWEQAEQPSPQEQQLAELMQQIQMIMAKLGIEEKTADVKNKQLEAVEKKQKIKQEAKENAIKNALGLVGAQRKISGNGNNEKGKKEIDVADLLT